MSKKEASYSEGGHFSSQSEIFESFLNISDWLEKVGSPKRSLLFLTCKR